MHIKRILLSKNGICWWFILWENILLFEIGRRRDVLIRFSHWNVNNTQHFYLPFVFCSFFFLLLLLATPEILKLTLFRTNIWPIWIVDACINRFGLEMLEFWMKIKNYRHKTGFKNIKNNHNIDLHDFKDHTNKEKSSISFESGLFTSYLLFVAWIIE